MKYEHISRHVYAINDLPQSIYPTLSDRYQISQDEAERALRPICDKLRDSIHACVEYPYVDRVYRDTYYNYFASKHLGYRRDSIRIALFDGDLSVAEILAAPSDDLASRYRGFFVIRPTPPKLMGRSMISPEALSNSDFLCCLSTVSSEVAGLSLRAHAFPHASQDIESMSCAETSIWAVMEYFGSRYPEYKPATPSEIIDIFKTTSHQRLLPSNGLTIAQISRALRLLGLSTRVYSVDAYPDGAFELLLNYYIESGIPIVAALSNGIIGHAVVLIGHDSIHLDRLPNPEVLTKTDSTGSAVRVIDTARLKRNHIIIDDNRPPYESHDFFTPGPSYYADPSFQGLEITSFVAPLHSRIYLEAFRARKLVDTILSNPIIGWPGFSQDDGRSLWIRFFLTSSRSYKRQVRNAIAMSDGQRKLLIGYSLPKFIWVAELSTQEHYLQQRAIGLIIVDATGGDTVDSVELVLYPGELVHFRERAQIEVHSTDWDPFELYRNNLRGKWCRWKAR